MRRIASIFILILVFTLGCKKKDDTPAQTTPQTSNPNPPSTSFKKLKTLRSVSTFTPNGTIDIATSTFNYNSSNGRITTINVMDSSYNGSIWTAGTFTQIFNYNSSVQVTSILYQTSTGTFTNAFIYDSNNKIIYDIMLDPSNPPDTTFYTYVASGMRLKNYGSGFYNIDYYSDNLDSTVSYNSTTNQFSGFRDKRTYNQTIDLRWAYLNQYYPASFFGSKYMETTYQGGGSAPLTTYVYQFDSQSYPTIQGQMGGGPNQTTSYYAYY
jgi:hypothetical protein